MKKQLISAGAIALSTLCATSALAHIGVANNTTPLAAAGQSSFAVANSTNEIQFLIPHGCTAAETVVPGGAPAVTTNLDTTKIEITVPAAIVTATTAASLRPSHSGEFGLVTVGAVDGSGNVKFTWTRNTAVSAADNQLYKVSIRMKVPATASATDFAIKKYQFLATQTCTSGGFDYVMSWGTANSPTLLSFPDKRKGFNKYTLDSTTVASFTAASGTATLAASLKSFFGDAEIVWFGKSGYSANTNTKAKIDALVVKDSSYSELGTKVGASIATTDTLWVKY